MNETRSCLVVQPFLSHYRYGVFTALDDRPDWRFTFAADPDSGFWGVGTIAPESLTRVKPLRNSWVGRVLWQRGLIREALTGDYTLALFSGDASFVSTWLAAGVLRLRRIPVAFWTIGWHRPEAGLKRLWRLGFYSLSTALLLYGEDGREMGLRLGFPENRMRVIGNSYQGPPVEAAPGGTEFAVPTDLDSDQRVWVGAVARLTSLKRFDMLLAACRSLRDAGVDIGVILAGDGSERENLRRLSQDLGVPTVFPGEVYDGPGLSSIYERLAVTVLPERAGLTVMQSLEHGTPVVTVADPYRQVPEFRAVRAGATGELFRADDVDDLAVAISRCLSLVRDDPGRIAGNCRQEVLERWSPQAHAERIVAALSDLCPSS